MKLKQLVSKSNENADFTTNYSKNIALRKKLFRIGSPIAICGFVIAAAAFILIGVFGADLKSIAKYTPLLISMFVLLVVFSVVFGVGLYVLRQASSLHTKKPEPETFVGEVVDIKKEKISKNDK